MGRFMPPRDEEHCAAGWRCLSEASRPGRDVPQIDLL